MMVTGFSMTKDLFKQLEALRGDVGRSRFIARLVEKELESKTNGSKRRTV